MCFGTTAGADAPALGPEGTPAGTTSAQLAILSHARPPGPRAEEPASTAARLSGKNWPFGKSKSTIPSPAAKSAPQKGLSRKGAAASLGVPPWRRDRCVCAGKHATYVTYVSYPNREPLPLSRRRRAIWISPVVSAPPASQNADSQQGQLAVPLVRWGSVAAGLGVR